MTIDMSMVSKRKISQFWKMFQNGCQFWTSEDGDSCELVIARKHPLRGLDVTREGAAAILIREYAGKISFKISVEAVAAALKPAYVYEEWVGHEFFDSNRRTGKLWRLDDDETPFPVWSFDPYSDEMMTLRKSSEWAKGEA